MKKMLVSSLMVLVGALSVQAADVNNEYTKDQVLEVFRAESPELKKIDLDQQLLALEYESMEEQVKELKRQCNRSEIAYNNAKNSSDSSSVRDKKDAYLKSYDNWMAGIRDFENFKYKVDHQKEYFASKKKAAEYSFVNQVEKYTELLGDVEALKGQLSITKDTYEAAVKKHELGMISTLDLEQSKIQYMSLEVQVKSMENILTSNEESLKLQLGINLTKDIQIKVEEVGDIKPFLLDLDTMARTFKKSSYDYNYMAFMQKQQDDYVKEIKEKYPEKHEELEKRLIEDRKLEIEYEEYKQSKQLMFISEYYNLKDKLDELTKATGEFTLAKNKFDDSKISFDAGNISQLKWRSAQNQFESAENTYDKAVNGYLNAIRRLELLLNGVEVK